MDDLKVSFIKHSFDGKEKVEKTVGEMRENFEKELRASIRRRLQVKIVKRLFFEFFPALEEKLTPRQLKRVLCEFDPEEGEGFELLYVDTRLKKILESSLEWCEKKIMSDLDETFDFTKKHIVNNFYNYVFREVAKNGL